MTTTVVHCKRQEYDVYIGRPAHGLRGSKWRNRFKEGRDGTREEVIAKFEAYLLANPALLAALPEIKGKRLGCWCAPLPCHGDVLARYADES